MAISDLFSSGKQVRNASYFSSIVNLASIDGEINPQEEAILKRLADKLNISEDDYIRAIEHPSDFPVTPPNSLKGRMERLYDLLTVIFADHNMDVREEALMRKYAIAIGFSPETSRKVIDKSVRLLSGRLDFDEYRLLLDRE